MKSFYDQVVARTETRLGAMNAARHNVDMLTASLPLAPMCGVGCSHFI